MNENECLAEVISEYLYDHLPLERVDTSYEGQINYYGDMIIMRPPLPRKSYMVAIGKRIDIPNVPTPYAWSCDENGVVQYFGERLIARLTSLHTNPWQTFAGRVYVFKETITLIYCLIEGVEKKGAKTMDIVQVWKASGEYARDYLGTLYRKSQFRNLAHFFNHMNDSQRNDEGWTIAPPEPVERQEVYMIPYNGGVGGTLHIYGVNTQIVDIPSGASVTVKWKE
jgi:hypothetical protein